MIPLKIKQYGLMLLTALCCFSVNAMKKYSEEANEQLIDAIERNDLGAVKSALQNGANVNALRDGGFPALMVAIEKEADFDIIKFLLENKADPNFKTVRASALILAVRNDDSDATKLLLENKADPNLKSLYGYTALMWAASNGNLNIVELLLDHGADPHAKNKDGKTAESIARERRYNDIADFIKNYTYKLSRQLVSVRDSKGTGNVNAPGKPDIHFKFKDSGKRKRDENE